MCLYNKNKSISVIVSHKHETPSQLFRHRVIDTFKDNIDIYGFKNKISYKLTGLKDYMFSIAIENGINDHYYSEKIIDCFVTGTVPIYCGSPSIGKDFDMNGILCFDSIDQLSYCIKDIEANGRDLYNKMLQSIKNNFFEAQKHLLAESSIYNILANKGII
jgi:hypothetical protein